jgi:hypothetical protein
MVAPNEFWLQVHQLAAAYDAEGENAAERGHNIIAEFHDMSPLAQHQVLAALLRLTVNVPAIYSLLIADIKKAKNHKPKSRCAIQERVA